MKRILLDILVGTLAIVAGVLVNYGLQIMTGVRLELYWGVSTFSPQWVLALFFLPVVGGFVVSVIYGFGGKILALFPPLVIQVATYLDTLYWHIPPESASVLPFIYWVLLVVVAMEFGGIGGFIGEVMIKRTYGRSPRHLIYKQASLPAVGSNSGESKL